MNAYCVRNDVGVIGRRNCDAGKSFIGCGSIIKMIWGVEHACHCSSLERGDFFRVSSVMWQFSPRRLQHLWRAVGEIVDTARKGNESLQSTPVAVTALTQAALTERQVVDVADLQRTTPNLAVGGAGTGPTGIVYMSLRGEAQNSPNSASDSAVGIYLDGVYYGRPIVGNLGVLDIAQAEILRGPQGTLFGRNTTGGSCYRSCPSPCSRKCRYNKRLRKSRRIYLDFMTCLERLIWTSSITIG
jgi:hypothetical protein